MAEFNYQNRRDFLKYFVGTSAVLAGLPALSNEALKKSDLVKLTILYTNDVHSRIEPFPSNDPKHANMGGFARRSAVVESIRKENENVLLLDAGDIFQGTPYFNLYQGELEYKLMSLMKYDATTIGNHDFDLGIDNITKQMPHASFSFINCNYDFKDTDLKNNKKISDYKVYQKGNIRIGVLGVGIDLNGLVTKENRQGLIYRNPIEGANKIAEILRHEKRCDFVVCLSHLGYQYSDNKVSDIVLAKESKFIDVIIGGHTHTFLEEPTKILNKQGIEVQVTQMGWAGIWLGRLDIYFDSYKKNIFKNSANRKV